MPISKPINLKEIRKTINISSSKNNNFLIFFTIFILYILISVLGTSDLMLLLPEHMFKMPLINFDLDLISFYILAPIMLFLLHFNILFNYNMYLKKVDIHNNKFDMETIDPSVYGYAYTLANSGIGGFLINLFLWIWIYIIPLIVLIFIYLRFADYHDHWITLFHLLIVFGDIIIIFLSFYYNNIHLKHQQTSIRFLSYIFRILLFLVFILGELHYSFIFAPVIKKMDPRIKLVLDKKNCDTNISQMYNFIFTKDKNITMPANCFPRLVVNETEMAKISHSALYLPRSLVENDNKNRKQSNIEKEKQLILEYGTRSNLAHRNLRYANLYGSILTRADLSHSDLRASDLRKSHLQATKLIDAKLQHAQLIGAKLNKADLEDANLTNANLTGAVIKNAQLSKSTLNNATMNGAKLEKSDFLKANLTSANFINANLPYSIFSEANLTSAIFIKANLTSANFIKATLSNSSFYEADLTSAKFKEANLSHSMFFKANLTSAKFKDANLSHSDFSKANLASAKFKDANLSHSIFYEANLTSATFDNCNLKQSDLSKTILISSSLRKSDLIGTTFYGAQLNNSSLREANLTATSLRNSNLNNTDFTDATLISVDFSGTYTDSKEINISLKTVLKSAKEVGGIIIQDIKSIKSKKPDRTYFTDNNLTICEKYLTIKLENSDINLPVTKRKIKYLIKGIEKYNNHEGEPTTKCLGVNSTKLSQTLQNALNTECSFLEDFLKINPAYKKTYAQTINDCRKDYTKKETKDLK